MYPPLEKFLLGPKFACIEAEQQEKDTVFHLTVLQRKGERAKVVLQQSGISSIDTLAELLDKKTPVVLTLTGKGIISRNVQANADISDDLLIKSVLNNAPADDLAVSRFPINESNVLVAIARKELYRKLVKDLRGISIVSVMLGAGCIINNLDLFPHLRDEFTFGNHQMKFQNGQVNELKHFSRTDNEIVMVGGESMPGSNVVSFLGALEGLSNTGSVPGEVSGCGELRKEFIRMKRYGVSVKVSLLIALIVLLTNFFVFSHFRQLKSELESNVSADFGLMEKFNLLQNKLETEQGLFVNSGTGNSASYAWLADQIAKDVPEDIVLSQVNISPPDFFNREDTIGFESDKVVIAGNCRESTSLDEWLTLLQQSEWVESATITNYSSSNSKDKAGEMGNRGKFELQLIFR